MHDTAPPVRLISPKRKPAGSSHLRFGSDLCLGIARAIPLLRTLVRFRSLRWAWRRLRRARRWRKLRRSVYGMDERLMKDVGIPPEQIRKVLAQSYATNNLDFW